MKKFIKSEILILFIVLSPVLFIAVMWNDFPERMPIHFNAQGEPNGYSNKVVGLFLLPLINFLLYILQLIIPRIDPSKKNYEKFAGTYKIIRLSIHLFLTVVFGAVVAFSLGYKFNFSFLMLYSVMVLFLIMGNYMSTIRHNYFLGVRTPWTLGNEEVWRKTHRLTARLWVIGSILVMILIPFVSHPEIVLMIFIVPAALIPILYSYYIFRKTEKEITNG